MGQTANLELTQFEKSDKPNWLFQYNADMRKIDAAFGRLTVDISNASTQGTNTEADLEALSKTVEYNKQVSDNNEKSLNDRIDVLSQKQTDDTAALRSELATKTELSAATHDISENRSAIGAVEQLLNDNYILSEERYVLGASLNSYITVNAENADQKNLLKIVITGLAVQGGALKSNSKVEVVGLVPLENNLMSENNCICFNCGQSVVVTNSPESQLSTANITCTIMMLKNSGLTTEVSKEDIVNNYRLLLRVYNHADFIAP